MDKQVRCRSGIMGWQNRLRDEYDDYEQFAYFDEMYGLAGRLGYANARNAWKSNPIIQGSVIPSDYRRVRERKSK